jgi:hypothetical protein
VPSLSPQTLHSKSLIPNQSQGHGSFKSTWRTIFPTYSSPGSLGFQVLRAGKISFKVLQFVPVRSIFRGGSKWFTLVNRLYMHPFTTI